MRRTIQSLRLVVPVIIIGFVLLTSLLLLSSLSAIDVQVNDQASLILAGGQTALIYNTALIANQLADVKTDSEREDNRTALKNAMTAFEQNQAALRNGDPSLHLEPIQHSEILASMVDSENEWNKYRPLLTQILTDKPENYDEDLGKIQDEAATVATRTDRVAKALQVIAEQNQRANQQTFVIIFVSLVLASLMTIAALLYIIRSVRTLVSTTREFSAGNYAARANVLPPTELADLSRAFNDMARVVQQRDAELTEINKSLEQRVAERTEQYRKARDEAVAATRLAQENTRLKSEFLSTMSHELRTPLNAIEGFTGIVLNKMGGTDFNSKTEEYLSRIRFNSRRLLQLINDFLDLSRIESGRLELANQPFSPAQLARRWQEEISVLAEKKGLQFEVSLDSTLPETIYGDEEAVSKVAINLLGNAIKFTEQGQVKLAVERNDGKWEIVVEDTGIGIPPHAREFIFEEFRQVDQTSKRKYGGTGLGLAIVQKYTRAMGGSVNVKSELGKGSVFTVTLPCKVSA